MSKHYLARQIDYNVEEDKLNKLLKDHVSLEKEAEEELQKLKVNHLSRLKNLYEEQINKRKEWELDTALQVYQSRLKYGLSELQENRRQSRLKKLEEEKRRLEEKLSNKKLSEEERRKTKEEYKLKLKEEKNFRDQIDKFDKVKDKLKKKLEKKDKENRKKELLTEYKDIEDTFSTKRLGGLLGTKKPSKKMIKAVMTEQGYTEDEIKEAFATNKKNNRIKRLSGINDFAKSLSSDIESIASAMSEVDTRLQGSKNLTKNGSYWNKLTDTVTSNLTASPLVKQADVVNNLKNLISKGIAFNVEQRAFLDTISSKIATTFEATDAALVQLVRIQQQDTTAARLGMESALTSFLNNMYETTEYMQGIASSIREQIYEASALMTAEDATAFEYQVQKWMGSLYSVGFSNTQGLAGALGKLASGDVSSLTDSGLGNLLVMAANNSGNSIAEILANGLDDTETNELMKAMVDYLGKIYNETKNSKVVAQQFANVYGLTASDLKAAANLANSTTNISNQNLSYGGMLTQLYMMADTMYTRTSKGEKVSNIWDNLKYGMAAQIAESPVLYGIYSAGTMLDQVSNGISVPLPMVMGTGMNDGLNIADLMRVGAMSGGILGGMGKAIKSLAASGLKQSAMGANLLNAFGVDKGTASVNRGNGDGLLTTVTSTVSSSGSVVANESSSDIIDKNLSDSQSKNDKQIIEEQDNSNETKLSTVDEHILSIVTLLEKVTDGNLSLQVRLENNSLGGPAWL